MASGSSRDHVAADFASGDSFFRIDFSSFTGTGQGLRLNIAGERSLPFDVSATNPYPRLADESFDYFEDHRTGEMVFEKFLHDWASGRIEGPFWNDAGDQGSYPTNTAMAAWLLMHLDERYPKARASLGETTLYEELKIGTALTHLDYILGTNAMALSMVTGFGEHAVERLHDPLVPDTEPGKMALGPNNWTNVGDPDMPAFGSRPGMKMMPIEGRGWAAREIAIDGNAPLVWLAWWAEHRAAALLGP